MHQKKSPIRPDNMQSVTTTVDSVVIIPTYNERENVAAIIEAVFRLSRKFDVLIIDDNSPDGTADIVKELQLTHTGRLHMIQRKGKLGLGTAYIAGFKWALEHGYEYIFEMDADFSHNPDDLMKLYEACAVKGADVAVGSRYVTGVNVVNWPMGPGANVILRIALRPHSHRHAYQRRDSRIRMLPPQSARNPPARPYTVQRLRIPDRDEISRL